MSAERPEKPSRQAATCADVRTAILTGVVTEAARAHGEACEACAELLADDALVGRFLSGDGRTPGGDGRTPGGDGRTPGGDEGVDLSAAVLARIARERNPVPRLPSAVRALLVWVAVSAPAAAMAAWKPRPDLAAYPVDRMALVVGALALAAAVGGLVAIRPIHRPLVAGRGLWVALGLLLPVGIAVLPRIENGIGFPWLVTTIHCFEIGAGISAIVLAGLWLSDRRSRPGATWWAAASAVSAISGGLLLQFSCPATEPGHLVFGHASIGLVFAAVAGAAIALRWTFTRAVA